MTILFDGEIVTIKKYVLKFKEIIGLLDQDEDKYFEIGLKKLKS